MIDIADVEQTILELEKSGTTYGNCSKLADLYAVRNEYYGRKKKSAKETTKMEYSFADKSDFLVAFENCEKEKAYRIIDEHMKAIQMLYPKEYNAVIKRLNE